MQNTTAQSIRDLSGDVDAQQGDVGASWSDTLTEVHSLGSNHTKLRSKTEEERAQTFLSLLSEVVEGQVIPRLMLAHNSANVNEHVDDKALTMLAANNGKAMDVGAIEPFAALVLSGNVEDLEDYVQELVREGVSSHSVYLDLMAPAARLLGQYWEDDRCSFTDVTMGLGRLQTLLYRLSAQHAKHERISENSPIALFLTPEGSQHSLGVRMVEELFRDAGWRTICEINIPLPIIISMVSHEAFDLIGISLSAQGQVAQTKDIIRKIRLASHNPNLKIILGGKLVVDDPDLAARLGADLFARDGREAIVIANRLLYKQLSAV